MSAAREPGRAQPSAAGGGVAAEDADAPAESEATGAAAFRPSAMEWLALAGGLFLCLRFAWLLDDAYVYFRYVDNLVLLDLGLVYNRGEYLEGYSSPLWTLLLALLRLTRLDYWLLVRAVGAGAFAASWAGLVLLQRWTGPRGVWPVNLPLVSIAFGYGTLCYFTSGTESPLVILAAVATALFAFRPRYLPAQAILALAPLARPELALPWLLCVGWYRLREGRLPWRWIGASAVLGGAWLAFRVTYYADWAPNTFHLKEGALPAQGWRYLRDATAPYHLGWLLAAAVALALLVRARGGAARVSERLFLLLLAVAVGAYVVRIGGDGRHLRYLVYPLVLALAATAGLLEGALALWVPRWSAAASAALGIALAAGTALQYPAQLAAHPLRAQPPPRMIAGIADAEHHRQHPRLPRLAPFGSGAAIELLPRYAAYGDAPLHERAVAEPLCWTIYERFDLRAVHSWGLTDPILARCVGPVIWPGHRATLKPRARDLVEVLEWWREQGGGDPRPGMHRAAVEAGVAAPWIALGLDSIERIERRAYNAHDPLANLRGLFTPIAPIR